MARSRSKQSRSRKASRKASRSSKSGRRSHHQRSSGESGLSRVLKLAERDYMIQTLGGFLDDTKLAKLPTGAVPGIDFVGTSPDAQGFRGSPEYYWKSFSLPELQAGFLQFTAQQKQLEKLGKAIMLYATNVEDVQGALQKALTDKYNESIKLNQQIALGLNPKSGDKVKLPMQTIFEFKEQKLKDDFTEALTKKRNAINKILGATSSPSSPTGTESTEEELSRAASAGMYRGSYQRRR